MLIVISPAKTLEMGLPLPEGSPAPTQPRLLERSEALVHAARKLSVKKLMALMDISQKLAEQNKQRFAEWQPGHTAANSHPALMVFRGEVYQGLAAETWTTATMVAAQERLRILSGLYGVLRPLDLMQPYRLEMGRNLKVGRANDLYAFWKTAPTELLAQDMAAAGTQVLLNLASEEYFQVVKPKALPAGTQVISPVFQDEAADGWRVMGFFAKRTRGLLARWVLEHPGADLQDFALEGYRWAKAESSAERPVFRRLERDRPATTLPRAPRKGSAVAAAAA